MKKNERGITLIALVVTIVVLLILAGVSISMLTGENGIITRAQESREENRGGAVEERRDLWVSNISLDEDTNSQTAQELPELLADLEEEGLLSDDEITYINENGYIQIGSHFIDFSLDVSDKIDWSKLEPGLYETGTRNMIKSWEELKNNGDITVDNNDLTRVSTELEGDLIISSEIVNIGSGSYALSGSSCGSLEVKIINVYIPSSVEKINDTAFGGFGKLKEVSIATGLKEINHSAFINCSELENINIPESVTKIGEFVFQYTYSLSNISVDINNKQYDSRDNCNAIIEKSTNTLLYGCKTTVIPSSVTSIGNMAFYYCYGLTNITIPDSVTSIGENAFYACSSLTTVNYTETKAQWNEIIINDGNEDLTNATIHCTDGDINA